MTQQRPQRGHVATALTEEAIREAVAQLVRGELADSGPLADALHHPPKRLLARRGLWVLPLALALVLRYPLLDLHREHVVVELRLQDAEALLELREHIRRERDGLPVRALPEYPDAAADQVDVSPPHAQDFGPVEAGALHEHDRRPLKRHSRFPYRGELDAARPVDVRLPLLRPAERGGGVDLNQILGRCPPEERMQH
ncbi:MAG TPA: hypothetical protein VHC67_14295 [Gaiellaceae bacterium]|nr:hypothetical protein [Gaiellaceae bacterium]